MVQPPVVISNLIGGLGNQMFQHACGRALAHRLGRPLKVSLDMFAGYRLHQGFELQRVFGVTTEPVDAASLRPVLGWRAHPLARRLLEKLPAPVAALAGATVERPGEDLSALAARAPVSHCYLQGYWQSERYFAAQAALVRDDFRFREPARDENARIAASMAEGTAVSIHVRRGDYVSNAKNASIYAACDLGYYERAIAHVLARAPDARLYVFSDDPSWVREALLPRHPAMTLVSHNRGRDSYNDMRLMSMCRHHVIANSSFSWWGAWLNPDPAKIVVAPQGWYADGRDDSGLVPEAWVRL